MNLRAYFVSLFLIVPRLLVVDECGVEYPESLLSSFVLYMSLKSGLISVRSSG